MEKTLPLQEQSAPAAPKTYTRRFWSTIALAALTVYLAKPLILVAIDHSHHGHHSQQASKASCFQPDPLFPPSDNTDLERMFEYLSTSGFQNASIARHSGAVQIATQSYDDMGPIGEDKRWEVMYPFAEYLEATFPRMHDELKFEKVNTHGLVYTWEGSDESLKPLLLMARE